MADRLIDSLPYLNVILVGAILWWYAATGWIPRRWATR